MQPIYACGSEVLSGHEPGRAIYAPYSSFTQYETALPPSRVISYHAAILATAQMRLPMRPVCKGVIQYLLSPLQTGGHIQPPVPLR